MTQEYSQQVRVEFGPKFINKCEHINIHPLLNLIQMKYGELFKLNKVYQF